MDAHPRMPRARGRTASCTVPAVTVARSVLRDLCEGSGERFPAAWGPGCHPCPPASPPPPAWCLGANGRPAHRVAPPPGERRAPIGRGPSIFTWVGPTRPSLSTHRPGRARAVVTREDGARGAVM